MCTLKVANLNELWVQSDRLFTAMMQNRSSCLESLGELEERIGYTLGFIAALATDMDSTPERSIKLVGTSIEAFEKFKHQADRTFWQRQVCTARLDRHIEGVKKYVLKIKEAGIVSRGVYEALLRLSNNLHIYDEAAGGYRRHVRTDYPTMFQYMRTQKEKKRRKMAKARDEPSTDSVKKAFKKARDLSDTFLIGEENVEPAVESDYTRTSNYPIWFCKKLGRVLQKEMEGDNGKDPVEPAIPLPRGTKGKKQDSKIEVGVE